MFNMFLFLLFLSIIKVKMIILNTFHVLSQELVKAVKKYLPS